MFIIGRDIGDVICKKNVSVFREYTGSCSLVIVIEFNFRLKVWRKILSKTGLLFEKVRISGC